MAFLFQASLPNYLKSRPIKFMIVFFEQPLSPPPPPPPPTAKKTLSGKFEIGQELWPNLHAIK